MKNFGINLVGTLIPKFQLPWRTLLVNRYDAFDRFRDEKIMPMVKKIAHYINERGKEVTYKDPVYSSGLRRAVLDKAVIDWVLGNKQGGTYKEHHNNIKQKLNKSYIENSKVPRSQQAALAAIAGSVIGMGGPYGKVIGTIIGIPDLVYDWAASIDEPENLRNHAHTTTNYAELLAKIIPGKWDDYVAKTGNFVSNMDDTFSAFGQDMYNLNSNEK